MRTAWVSSAGRGLLYVHGSSTAPRAWRSARSGNPETSRNTSSGRSRGDHDPESTHATRTEAFGKQLIGWSSRISNA